MSDGPVVATEKAIYNAIYGDSDIISNLGSYCIYNTVASQQHGDNYIVFSMIVDDDDVGVTTQAARNRDLLYDFKCVSYDKLVSSTVSDLMDTLFHNNYDALAISGWSVIWIGREDSINITERDPANRAIFHVGFQLRIRIEEDQ